MEQRSVSDLISQYEPFLRKFEGDDALRITEVEEEAGCKMGDNYMSVVMQTRLKGSRGNGTRYSKDLVTKYLPHHREITKVFRTGDLFKNESYFYETLLPILGDFGPTCIHADGDKIVMEDLRSKGYVVCKRQELMDLDHSLETVKTLARLHASSLALKFNDEEKFLKLIAPLKEAIFPQDTSPHLGSSINGSLDAAIAHLEWLEPKNEELEAGIRYLKSQRLKAHSEIQELVIPRRRKHDVLTHGDCWNNNVMFRHNADGKVADVKLLDFQIARHASPALDFHYFVYSSPKSEVIEEHYEELVAAYHEAFANTLRAKYSAPKEALEFLKDDDWFRDELRANAKYGLFTACWIASAILAEDHDAIDMDKITKEDIEALGTGREIKIKPKIAPRLGTIVLDYMQRYA